MQATLSAAAVRRAAALILFAFCGGILNGLVGSGAGIIFLFMWSTLAPRDSDPKSRYGFSMTAVLLLSVVALFLYPAQAASSFPLPILLAAVVAGTVGGASGALLKERVRTAWLNRAFGLITLYAGISMVCGR